jgi:dehydrogenase/reductase SDR family protein 12
MIARAVDGVLEASVVGSFTSLGYRARRRLFSWDEAPVDLTGRSVLITGGTSGLGRAAAVEMARRGARVLLTGRDPDRGARVEQEIAAEARSDQVTFLAADMADLAQTRALAAQVAARLDHLDVLVHNAGALLADRRVTVDGLETTFQVHVVAPAVLTREVLPLLERSADGRVVWVSSGGMYSQKLSADAVEMGPDDHDGTAAYARAKRAQVEMAPRWAERLAAHGVTAHVMHPGWADTPGVEASLPTFRRVMGPLLRTPDQGADTIVWLAGVPRHTIGTGRFWLDRRPRSAHKVPWTKLDDPQAEVERVWNLVAERAGLDDLVPASR